MLLLSSITGTFEMTSGVISLSSSASNACISESLFSCVNLSVIVHSGHTFSDSVPSGVGFSPSVVSVSRPRAIPSWMPTSVSAIIYNVFFSHKFTQSLKIQ